MNNIVILPGDGYTKELHLQFINFLKNNNFKVCWIPLMEDSYESVSYEDLESKNYIKYINSFIPSDFTRFILYGISKGAHLAKIYASYNYNKVIKLILAEDTMLNPNLMEKYEVDRGNDFIVDMKNNNYEDETLDNTKKMLDVSVSDKNNYFPKCPINIIWTSRNNQNEPYDETVLSLKRKYVNYLKNGGCHVKVFNIDAIHTLDLEPKYFNFLLKVIRS